MKYLTIIFAISIVSFSCNKAKTIDEIDKEKIKEYIDDNNLIAESTESGLYYVIETEGSGEQPNFYSTVTVDYKGYFLDGKVFDESDTAGITFGLPQVIRGWQEGIPKFKEGGSGILLIPSQLGYGTNGSGSVPANTVLIFDIELKKVL